MTAATSRKEPMGRTADLVAVIPQRSVGIQSGQTVSQDQFPVLTSILTILQDPGINRQCDYNRFGQACAHYKSVADYHHLVAVNNHEPGYNPLTCPYTTYNRGRPEGAPDHWTTQHLNQWWIGYMQGPHLDCEADEYPPYAFWQDQSQEDVYIRKLPQAQNGPAGQLFKLNFCTPQYSYAPGGNAVMRTAMNNVVDAGYSHDGNQNWHVFSADCTITASTLYIDFRNVPADYATSENPCWPKTLIDDPGFAFLTQDPWYDHYADKSTSSLVRIDSIYEKDPGAYTQGKPPRAGYNKRALFDSNVMAFNDGNVTRKLSDADVARVLGIADGCDSEGCEEEIRVLRRASGFSRLPEAQRPSSPVSTSAEPTAVDAQSSTGSDMTAKAGSALSRHGIDWAAPTVVP